MKKNSYKFFNSKTSILMFLLVFLSSSAFAQWSIYDGKLLPDASDPVFGVSGSGGAGLVSTLVTDPDNAENSFLELNTVVVADNGAWRRVFAAPVTDLTVVMRVKAASASGRRVVELDIDNGGFRERLYINQEDNTIRLHEAAGFGSANEFPLPDGGSVSDWNIYRITKDATGNVKLYVNENPVALAEGTSATTTSNNHFRFGDNNGSHNVSALVDWVIWDKSGTYAPGEGTAIPEGFIPEEGEPPVGHNWRIYDGNQLPSEQIPVFDESNVAGVVATNQIIEDPEDVTNGFLETITASVGDTYMWRTMLQPDTDAMTVVFKVKAANETARRVLEFDLHHNGIRERVYINREENRVRLNHAIGGGDGGEIPAPDGTNLSDWNIYRVTKDGADIKLYLNEDPTPLAMGTSTTTTTQQYFRFGGGNSSHNFAALIDWIIWDETGAFAPGEGSAIPEKVVTTPWDATLSELTVGGTAVADFDPTVLEYEVVLAADVTEIPQIAAVINDTEAELLVTQATAIPGTATAVVTAVNGFTVNNYTVNFRHISSNALLQDLLVDAVTITDFDADVFVYNIELAQGTETVVVTAETADPNAEVVITQATELPGVATIVVTAEDGTIVTYTINFTLDSTGINDPQVLEFKVFPNPAKAFITLNWASDDAAAVVEIINTSGQIVLRKQIESQDQTLDISKLSQGTYVIQLTTGKTRATRLFIKQ